MYLLNFDWPFFQVPVSSSGALGESAMVIFDRAVKCRSTATCCDHWWRATRSW